MRWNRTQTNSLCYIRVIYNQKWYNYSDDKSLDNLKVAYFSMEFGLTECMPLYSGGLGILAGDHLKSTSFSDFRLLVLAYFISTAIFVKR